MVTEEASYRCTWGTEGCARHLWEGVQHYQTPVEIKDSRIHHPCPSTAEPLAYVPPNLYSKQLWLKALECLKWKCNENYTEALRRCDAHAARCSSKTSFLRVIIYDWWMQDQDNYCNYRRHQCKTFIINIINIISLSQTTIITVIITSAQAHTPARRLPHTHWKPSRARSSPFKPQEASLQCIHFTWIHMNALSHNQCGYSHWLMRAVHTDAHSDVKNPQFSQASDAILNDWYRC